MLILLIVCYVSFSISSLFGFGGSLVLLPFTVSTFGYQKGLAIAALLLAGNNLFKCLAYSQTLPWSKAGAITIAVVIGGILSEILSPFISTWVGLIAIFAGIMLSIHYEFRQEVDTSIPGVGIGFLAGLVSSVSGTASPAKGLAVRLLSQNRMQQVGTASLIALTGSTIKTVIFINLGFLSLTDFIVLWPSIAVMVMGTFTGYYINRFKLNEAKFARLWWTIIGIYIVRLFVRISMEEAW